MRVFTHYYPICDYMGFKWRTLLQFGDSWDIIGSVVIGLDSPLHKKSYMTIITESSLLSRLRKFDNADSRDDNWYEYEPSKNMEAINKMFTMRCEYQGVPLKGIVQIYFLRDIWDAIYYNKEEKDYRKFKIQEKILQYDIESLRPPIYIGGRIVPIIGLSILENLEPFFNRAIELGTKYLNKDLWKNEFLNPVLLLSRAEENDPKAVAILEQFIRE